MANQADGSIVIDTALDADGFGKENEKLKGAVKSLGDRVNGLGGVFRKNMGLASSAVGGTSSKLIKLEADVKKASDKLEIAKQKLSEFENASYKPSAGFKKFQNQINSEIAQIDRLNERYQSLLSIGYTEHDPEVTETIRQMEQLEAHINSLKRAQENLKAAENTRRLDSSQYQQLANNVASASSALDIARARLTEFRSGQNGAAKCAGGLTAMIKRLTSSFHGLHKAEKKTAGGFGQSFKTLLKYSFGVRSLFVLMNKLRSAVSDGFKNLVRYDSEANTSISMVMSSLTTLKNTVATAFAPLVNIAAPILTRFIDLMSTAIDRVSQFTAMLSGKSSYTKAVKVQQDYAASLEGAADAANDAKKAQDGYLSGLDEITRFKDPEENSSKKGGLSSSDMFETAEIETPLTDAVTRFKDILSGVFDVFKAAWDSKGQHVIDSLTGACRKIGGLFRSIGESFRNIFENGTGQESLEHVLGIASGISDMFGNLSERIRLAWESGGVGTSIVQSWWNMLNDILGMFEKMATATKQWAAGLNFEPILTAFASLSTVLEPVVALITDSLAWAYENVLLPLGKWTIEDAAPASLKTLSSAITALKNLLGPTLDGFKKLWSGLKPIFEWIGERAVEIIDQFGVAFSELGDVLERRGPQIIRIFEDIANTVKEVWKVIEPICNYAVKNVKLAFNQIVDAIKAAINVALDVIGYLVAGIKENIINAKKIFGDIIDFIKNVFIGDWKNAWNSIKKIFVDIWNMMVQNVKRPINLIIDIINDLIKGVCDGINNVLGFLNSFHIDVPDWVPVFGGDTWGFNVPTIQIPPQIPHLATGAVIPPNAPFTAILGDQRSGTNIETPLATMIDAFNAALDRRGNRGGSYRFTAQLNRRVIFDEVIEEAKLRQTLSGSNPFELA